MLEATGVGFEWDVQEAGVDVMESAGTPLPEATLASVRQERDRAEGPDHDSDRHGFPLGQRGPAPRARPVRLPAARASTYPGMRSRYDNVDLVVVRENTEDLYAGIEYEAGSPEAGRA